MESKARNPNVSINLGTYEVAAKRRDAYMKAANKEGYTSFSLWAKEILDKAAGFKLK